MKSRISDMDRGMWNAIETLAHSYEEGAVKVLMDTSKFSQEKCVALTKETGYDPRGTMKVVDYTMNWKTTLTEVAKQS